MDAAGESGMGVSVDAGAGEAVREVSAYECGVHMEDIGGEHKIHSQKARLKIKEKVCEYFNCP